MSLSFNFTNNYDMPNGYELMIKLNNGNTGAWMSYPNLATPSNTHYNTSEYYPNINLLRVWKTTTSTVYSISLGTYPTSNAVSSWGFSFAYVSSASEYYEGNFTGGIASYSSSISVGSTWSGTLARTSGLAYLSMVNIYTFTWSSSAYSFPEGSYMILTFNRLSVPSPLADQCKSMSGFTAGSAATSIFLCRRLNNNQIAITGYATINPSTSLSITSWFFNSGSTESISITVYSSTGAQINTGSVTGITVGGSYTAPGGFSIKEAKQVSLFSQTTTPMYFTFTLSTNTLVNGDYVTLDLGNWTIGTPSADGSVTWKYTVGTWVYWVPTTVTVSGSIVTIPVYSNYSMFVGQSVTIYVSHVMPSDFNGIKVTNNQWNYFTIKAYKSGSIVEHQYLKLWTPTDSVASAFTITPCLGYTSATSLYTITITPNINVLPGDVISIEFVTNDLKYTFWDAAIGKAFSTTSFALGCKELDSNTYISDSRITCKLFKGISASQVPVVVQIPVSKNIAAGTTVNILITDMLNPASNAGLPVGITGKIMRVCERGDQTNLCAVFRSTYYMSFATGSAPAATTVGSLVASPGTVSSSPAVHTISNSNNTVVINAGDYIRVVYYSPMVIPDGCTVAGHSCWTFPSQNQLIVKFSSAISPFSFALQNMTNLYKQYSANPGIEVWRAGVVAYKFTVGYSHTTITSDLTTTQPLTIGFTPTLTSNYQLKVNFNNIAKIEIKYIYQNSKVSSIWLVVDTSQITLITTYCNATLTSTASEAKPYPYRFYCEHMSSGKVRLTLPSKFPAFDSTFPTRSIIIYLEYIIVDTVTTVNINNWVATAYAGTTETNVDLISQAVGKFAIAPYISPPISSVDFHTTSFTSRTCTINDQCMFYGYLLPSTLKTSYQISKMVFTLPPEFGYAPITSLTKCLMKGYTDVSISSCNTDRTNSTFTITYVPASYDHNYKLITLNTDATKLFTSPAYPGSHYQMGADLYTTLPNGTDMMVETTKVNVTTVYGEYLSVPSIVAKIPLDADAYGMFDIQFLVGTKDIPPAYPSTASNTITSQIALIFANTFAFDLGTGYKAGDTVACVPVSGLTFTTMDRLVCKLYPSTSSITYPTVRVTGYDRIANASTVRLRLAGLKTLPVGITDYIKVGVELVYFNYGGVTGNLYEPTSVVVGPPTTPIVPYAMTFTVSENSSNIVGELANYNFTGSIGAGFSPVTTTDYFAVSFPTDAFERNFSINSAALCSLASGNTCYSFGKASIIYFSPSATFNTASFTFLLSNITQAAYLFDYRNVTFTLMTIVNNKVNAKGTTNITKVARVSKNASAIVTSTSSSYGGDTGINYTIQFQLNHNMPTDGVVTITMPQDYPSLYSLSSQCVLSLGVFSTSTLPYCTIGNDHQVNIYPNGTSLTPTTTYGLTITNITNPDKFLNGNQFTITTYYSANIYNKTIISQNTFSAPAISKNVIKNCTFQVTPTATNANISTMYTFTMICPAFIKQSSEIKVYPSWKPALANLTCASDTDSLYSYSCAIKQEFSGSTSNTYLSLLVRNISSMKLF